MLEQKETSMKTTQIDYRKEFAKMFISNQMDEEELKVMVELEKRRREIGGQAKSFLTRQFNKRLKGEKINYIGLKEQFINIA